MFKVLDVVSNERIAMKRLIAIVIVINRALKDSNMLQTMTGSSRRETVNGTSKRRVALFVRDREKTNTRGSRDMSEVGQKRYT